MQGIWTAPRDPSNSRFRLERAALLRAASDLDTDATIVSLDSRCAYDTVSHAAFLTKLLEV